MKLFVKILLTLFTILTTVGETNSSTVVNISQTVTSSLLFQETQFSHCNHEFGLVNRQLSDWQIAHLGTLHSEQAIEKCVQSWLDPSFGNMISFEFSEIGAQWQTPELVIAGLSAGFLGWQAFGTKAVDAASHVVARDGMQSAAKGTTVYRAVNAAERASINDTKSFLLKEGGTEVKYFARTLEDAHWYGSRLYPEGYSVIKGSIDLSLDAGKYWYPHVDIGAYAFPEKVLPHIRPIIP